MKKEKPLLFLSIIILLELLVLNQNKLPLFNNSVASTPQIAPAATLQKYADQVLTKCAANSHHQSCYDTEIPKLMDFITIEDAFQVTKIIQERDPTFPYCHVLGHNLSAREVKKDPSKWKEVVSRCPSGMCSNGCIHGGFQEKFRAESLTDGQIEDIKPDLKTICEKRDNWNPTGLEQASCYHALGHLTMYLTSADIPKSIKLCEEIAIKTDGRNFSQVCFDGVFMQIFQPLEPEDFALVAGKVPSKEEVEGFCSNYDGIKRGSCLSESWPLYRQELLSSPENLVKFCARSEAEQNRCYLSLFYVLTSQFNFDTEKITNYCLGLPQNRQGQCFANASSRLIETDYRNIEKSVRLCSNAGSEDNKNTCFKELLQYSTYNFHAGSEPFYKLCNGLPQPWQERCLTKS